MIHPDDATRHRLDFLIAPRSVAVVGASERNHFATLAMRALKGLNYQGPLHLVNQKATPGRSSLSLRAAVRADRNGA
jgi:acyl-CoA synthetase (NDP forming)